MATVRHRQANQQPAFIADRQGNTYAQGQGQRRAVISSVRMTTTYCHHQLTGIAPQTSPLPVSYTRESLVLHQHACDSTVTTPDPLPRAKPFPVPPISATLLFALTQQSSLPNPFPIAANSFPSCFLPPARCSSSLTTGMPPGCLPTPFPLPPNPSTMLFATASYLHRVSVCYGTKVPLTAPFPAAANSFSYLQHVALLHGTQTLGALLGSLKGDAGNALNLQQGKGTVVDNRHGCLQGSVVLSDPHIACPKEPQSTSGPGNVLRRQATCTPPCIHYTPHLKPDTAFLVVPLHPPRAQSRHRCCTRSSRPSRWCQSRGAGRSRCRPPAHAQSGCPHPRPAHASGEKHQPAAWSGVGQRHQGFSIGRWLGGASLEISSHMLQHHVACH